MEEQHLACNLFNGLDITHPKLRWQSRKMVDGVGSVAEDECASFIK
jgi:hypothetical protein